MILITSHFVTDGSKTNNGTAAAAVSGDIVKSLRITSHASIFTLTAELVALDLALDIIRRSRRKHLSFPVILYLILYQVWLVSIHNCQLETGCSEVHHKLLSTGQCRKVYYLGWIPGLTTEVSEVMNMQMRLQKQLSAQQFQL